MSAHGALCNNYGCVDLYPPPTDRQTCTPCGPSCDASLPSKACERNSQPAQGAGQVKSGLVVRSYPNPSIAHRSTHTSHPSHTGIAAGREPTDVDRPPTRICPSRGYGRAGDNCSIRSGWRGGEGMRLGCAVRAPADRPGLFPPTSPGRPSEGRNKPPTHQTRLLDFLAWRRVEFEMGGGEDGGRDQEAGASERT